jgi:hypothetical protein
MDLPHLEYLRRLLNLLAARGEDVTHTRPACYSGVGFTPALRAAEADWHVRIQLAVPVGRAPPHTPGGPVPASR